MPRPCCCQPVYPPVNCPFCEVAPGAWQLTLPTLRVRCIASGATVFTVAGGTFICDEYHSELEIDGAPLDICTWLGPFFEICDGIGVMPLVTLYRLSLTQVHVLYGYYVGWEEATDTVSVTVDYGGSEIITYTSTNACIEHSTDAATATSFSGGDFGCFAGCEDDAFETVIDGETAVATPL